MPTENKPTTSPPSFNLNCADGGRGYIAYYFGTVLKRYDYTRYINERLAGDFACTLAQHFEGIKAREAALQQRLTAADERVDVLTKALTDVREALGRDYWDQYAGLDETRDILDAALKPAEAPRNQCDGCQAGIPVVNGAHRMGKPGGYPDLMGCTAKLYKPAEGGGDGQ